MTVLVDTSVWSAALRRNGDRVVTRALTRQVESGATRVHPWVLGELVLGGLSATARSSLQAHAVVAVVQDVEVLSLVDAHGLASSGIGWVDAQLLACAAANGLALWTLDRALADAADRLGCGFTPPD